MSIPFDHHMALFLHELPKCEHHLHIEGTLEPQMLLEFASRNNIKLPDFFPKSLEECHQLYSSFKDLQHFLDHYYIGICVLITEQDYYDLAMAYFKRAHQENCLHSEIFFDPQAHLERGVAIETIISGLNRACKDASESLGTSNKLIMCLLRHLPPDLAMSTVHQSKPYYEAGIIHGLGLDSSEVDFRPGLFEDCYKTLKNEFPTVGLTAHAGEEGDHTYVSDALSLLGVTRIDHGVQSVKSDVLMEKLAQEKVMLTVCPLSNIKLQVFDTISQIPIDQYLRKGVPFSINSDDPAYFGGYILDNYYQVHKHFGLSFTDWKTIATNSIEGSWCDSERKKYLLDKTEQVFNKYNRD